MLITSQQIVDLRAHTGLTQAQLGFLMGVSAATVAHWESGIRRPPMIYQAVLQKLIDRVEHMPDTKRLQPLLLNKIVTGGILGFLAWLYAE